MQISILVSLNIEICRLGKVVIKTITQAHAALDKLSVKGRLTFTFAPQHLDNNRAAEFPWKVEEPATFAILRHVRPLISLVALRYSWFLGINYFS